MSQLLRVQCFNAIMGRNKFGPQRGPWENHDWKGWWGDTPPFSGRPIRGATSTTFSRRWMGSSSTSSPARAQTSIPPAPSPPSATVSPPTTRT